MARVFMHFLNGRSDDNVLIIVELPESSVNTHLFDAILVAWGAHPLARDLSFTGAFDAQHKLLVSRNSLQLYTTTIQLRESEGDGSQQARAQNPQGRPR